MRGLVRRQGPQICRYFADNTSANSAIRMPCGFFPFLDFVFYLFPCRFLRHSSYLKTFAQYSFALTGEAFGFADDFQGVHK